MHIEDYIPDAIEMISAWDIPDEEFADAVNAQARLMAGICPDEPGRRRTRRYLHTSLS